MRTDTHHCAFHLVDTASPSASVLAVTTSQVRASSLMASTGVISTTGAVGAVLETVMLLLVNAGASDRPGGRWVTGGYDIVPSDALPNYTCSGPRAFLGALPEPAHPIASFAWWFDGGAASCRATTNPLVRGREVLRWSDGRMLASVHNFRRRADLGFTQDSTLYSSNAWNKRCDGGRIIANAVDYTIFSEPCPGDFNGDGRVDDSDFVLFALYYNELTDPRGDLNGDNNTDDADFVTFANRYNDLICP